MVEIAEDVYVREPDFGYTHETIRVVGTFAEAEGIAALHRVGDRFMAVDEFGFEHGPEVDWNDLGARGVYTPNYVSDPKPDGDGIVMYVDCKGDMSPAMRACFIAILVEELAVLDRPSAQVRVEDVHLETEEPSPEETRAYLDGWRRELVESRNRDGLRRLLLALSAGAAQTSSSDLAEAQRRLTAGDDPLEVDRWLRDRSEPG